MAALSYHEQEIIENTKRLRQMLKELPPFCADFFRGIEPRTSSRTRIAYAYDLKTFFDFLRQENPLFANCEMRDFSLTVLDEIQVMDFEEYMEFLKCHSTLGMRQKARPSRMTSFDPLEEARNSTSPVK